MKRLSRVPGLTVLLFALSIVSIEPAPCAHAGECTEGDRYYLERLEYWAGRPYAGDPRARSEIGEALGCLTHNRIDPRRWAGPSAAGYLRSLRQSPQRARVEAACVPYLTAPPPVEEYEGVLSLGAAEVLAFYGLPRAGGHDVFEILVRRSRATGRLLPYMALASIGDPRVFSLLDATYDSLAAAPRTDRVRWELIGLVNCLYHLPGDSAMALAAEIASADPDTAITARARHVLRARGNDGAGGRGAASSLPLSSPAPQTLSFPKEGGAMAKVREGNRPVLLVVDVQVGVVKGAWDASRIVGNVARVVERARAAGVPVIWVQHEGDDLPAGSPAWQWVPELVPAEDENRIHKRFNSAFEETPLESDLARLGATHIVLAGAATNWCIRATAYGALERGYDLTLVKDAHTTETMEFDDGGRIEASQIIRELNIAMTWVEYPGRKNGTATAAEVDFSLPGQKR